MVIRCNGNTDRDSGLQVTNMVTRWDLQQIAALLVAVALWALALK